MYADFAFWFGWTAAETAAHTPAQLEAFHGALKSRLAERGEHAEFVSPKTGRPVIRFDSPAAAMEYRRSLRESNA